MAPVYVGVRLGVDIASGVFVEVLAEASTGPIQAGAYRCGCQIQHGSDLAVGEVLVGGEPHDLAIGHTQNRERRDHLFGVGAGEDFVVGCRDDCRRDEPSETVDQPLVPVPAAALVRGDPECHPI